MHEAVRKARQQQKDKLKDCADDIIRNRHPQNKNGDPDGMKDHGSQGRKNNSDGFGKAGIPPHAPVHAEQVEDHNADGCKWKAPCGIGVHVSLWNSAVDAVKPGPERNEIGSGHRHVVISDQQDRDNLPMLKTKWADFDLLSFRAPAGFRIVCCLFCIQWDNILSQM